MRRRTFVSGLVALGAVSAVPACATPAPARIRRIGYLTSNIAAPIAKEVFHRKLRELGYVEGRGISIEYKPSNVTSELIRMAAELVAEPVDVIVASGGPAHTAAANATTTIPIVTLRGPDPVATGLADSHARPGRNVTGIGWNATAEGPKKLQLLKEAVPTLRRVALLYRSDNTSITSANAALEVAPSLGVDATLFGIGNVDESNATLQRIESGRFDGLLATSILTVVPSRTTLPDFAARLHMPHMYGDIEIAYAGGLMHYGANFEWMDEQSAIFVDKILHGANPAELPIMPVTPSDFVINFAAAGRIDLTFPGSILRQATLTIP